jgi:solute carrier family 25 phosphate transporter 23/24/25/41
MVSALAFVLSLLVAAVAVAVAVTVQVSGWQGARELHSDHGSVVVYRGMTDCFVRTGEGMGLSFDCSDSAKELGCKWIPC